MHTKQVEKQTISVKGLVDIGFPRQTAKNLIIQAKDILVDAGKTQYNNRKLQQVPREIIEDMLGTPPTKENFITARTLERTGHTKSESKNIIRTVKRILSKTHSFYSNRKVNFVPLIAVEIHTGKKVSLLRLTANPLLAQEETQVIETSRKKGKTIKPSKKSKRKLPKHVYERCDTKSKKPIIYYEIYVGIDPVTNKPKYLKSQTDSNNQRFTSYDQAHLVALQARARYKENHQTINEYSLYTQLVEQQFLPNYEKTVAPRTFDGTLSRLKIIKTRFGNKELRKITREEIQHFKTYLLTIKKYSSGHASAILGTLKQTLRFAVDYGYLEKNVAENISIPKEQKEIEILEKNQVDEILKHTDPTTFDGHLFSTAIKLMFSLGLRPNECLGLEWNDLDIENKTLSIWGTLVKEKGKPLYKKTGTKTKSGIRTLPISDDIFNALLNWKRHQEHKNIHTEFIFSKNGKPMYAQTIAEKLKKISRELSIPEIPLKNLRHSFATYTRYELDIQTHDISEFMGHSSVTITEKHYIKKRKVATTKIADKMNESNSTLV
jgi:integrase